MFILLFWVWVFLRVLDRLLLEMLMRLMLLLSTAPLRDCLVTFSWCVLCLMWFSGCYDVMFVTLEDCLNLRLCAASIISEEGNLLLPKTLLDCMLERIYGELRDPCIWVILVGDWAPALEFKCLRISLFWHGSLILFCYMSGELL